MTRLSWLLLSLCTLVALPPSSVSAQGEKPNIVFISDEVTDPAPWAYLARCSPPMFG